MSTPHPIPSSDPAAASVPEELAPHLSLQRPSLLPMPPAAASSSELGLLFAALSKVQAALPGLPALALNEQVGTPYISLATILSNAQPLLLQHELSLVQMPHGGCLRTILGHSSGQHLVSDTPVLLDSVELSGMQSYARSVSFARRIAAAAILGVIHLDNDGETSRSPASGGMRGSAGHPGSAGSPNPSGGASSGASPSTKVRGFSVDATIEAIKGKKSPADLDVAEERVKAAFQGDDLDAALKAISERRTQLGAGSTA